MKGSFTFRVRSMPVSVHWAFIFPLAAGGFLLLVATAELVNKLADRVGADALPADPPTIIWVLAGIALPMFVACLAVNGMGHVFVARRLAIPIKAAHWKLAGCTILVRHRWDRPEIGVLLTLGGLAPLLLIAGASTVLAAFAFVAGWVGAGLPLAVLAIAATLALCLQLLPGVSATDVLLIHALLWAITGNYERGTRHAGAIITTLAACIIGVGFASVLFRPAGISPVAGILIAGSGVFFASNGLNLLGHAELLAFLQHYPAESAVNRALPRLHHDARVDSVIDGLTADRLGTLYLVTDSERLAGVLTFKQLASVPLADRYRTAIADIMIPSESIPSALPGEDCASLLLKMDPESTPAILVAEGRGPEQVVAFCELGRLYTAQRMLRRAN